MPCADVAGPLYSGSSSRSSPGFGLHTLGHRSAFLTDRSSWRGVEPAATVDAADSLVCSRQTQSPTWHSSLVHSIIGMCASCGWVTCVCGLRETTHIVQNLTAAASAGGARSSASASASATASNTTQYPSIGSQCTSPLPLLQFETPTGTRPANLAAVRAAAVEMGLAYAHESRAPLAVQLVPRTGGGSRLVDRNTIPDETSMVVQSVDVGLTATATATATTAEAQAQAVGGAASLAIAPAHSTQPRTPSPTQPPPESVKLLQSVWMKPAPTVAVATRVLAGFHDDERRGRPLNAPPCDAMHRGER
jgi:hypothetical protein